MKRFINLLIVLLVFGLLVSNSFAQKTEYFAIGTSGIGGTYYQFGAPFASIISNVVPNAKATVQSTGGPSNNVQLMEKGEMKLAYCSVAAGYEGWTGTGWADGKKYREMRAIFPTYPSYFQLVVQDKSPIQNIKETGRKFLNVEIRKYFTNH